MTGAIFDGADLTGVRLAAATFDVYVPPPKKVGLELGAQLGRAVAKEVAKGLLGELGGDDDGDDGAATEEEEGDGDEVESLLSPDDVACALNQIASTTTAGLEQLLRVRAILSTEFDAIRQRGGASNGMSLLIVFAHGSTHWTDWLGWDSHRAAAGAACKGHPQWRQSSACGCRRHPACQG